MVSDLDIYRSAKLLIDQHGDDAATEAAMRADKMIEKGAVPFVSAVAALHIAAGLPPDSERVCRTLASSARALGAPGRDEVFGWGLIGIGTDCP